MDFPRSQDRVEIESWAFEFFLSPERAKLEPVLQTAARVLRDHGARVETLPDDVFTTRFQSEQHERKIVQEIWEALASESLIPNSWTNDPHRWIDGKILSPELAKTTKNLRRDCYPDTVASAITLASDVEGITQAEAFAKEFTQSLRAWGIPTSPFIKWEVLNHKRAQRSTLGVRATRRIATAVYFASTTEQRADNPWRSDSQQIGWENYLNPTNENQDNETIGRYSAADLHLRWRACCDWGLCVNERSLHGARLFSSLTDPTIPYLGILRTGYALVAVRENATILVAPTTDSHDVEP